ncbi:MAG: TolC family protein [Acidobacteriota bacterium]|nr:MAG: TolC family protein [Acidobacteriota bacterium]
MSVEGLRVLGGWVREALRNNPGVLASRQEWETATLKPPQESALPNPEVALGSMSGPLPFTMIGEEPLAWASVMVSQTLPWPGKRSLRGESATAEADRMSRMSEARSLQVAREVKSAALELLYIGQAERTLGNYQELLKQMSEIAAARYGVGKGEQQDVLRSQVEISLVVEQLERLRRDRTVVSARIKSLLNRDSDTELEPLPAIEITTLQKLPLASELYRSASGANPELDARRVAIRKAEIDFQLAKKAHLPDFKIGFSYLLRGEPYSNMYEYQVGVEIPLFRSKKEDLGVQERFGDLRAAKLAVEEQQRELAFQIQDACERSSSALRLLELYRTGILPQSRASLDSALVSYQTGRIEFESLVSSALTLLTYELKVWEENRNALQAVVDLEALVSRDLLN